MIYKIIISNTKDVIELTEQEFKEVMQKLQNFSGKGFITTTQGLFNPSFLVAILPEDTNYTRLLGMQRQGMYKCAYGHWHKRGEQCAHGEAAKWGMKSK